MLKLLLILLNKENIKKEPDHKLNRRILTSLISKTLLTARRLDSVNILQRSFSYDNPMQAHVKKDFTPWRLQIQN